MTDVEKASGAKKTTTTSKEVKEPDYTLKNPDVVTKYKTAGEIATKVLAQVRDLCLADARVLDICMKGDELILQATDKIYRGKGISKGVGFPTSLSINHVAAHFTPLPSDKESETVLKEGDVVKISLGAQIDGFGAILGDTLVVGSETVTGKKADVITAAHLASEAAIRLIKPGGVNWDVTDAVQKIAEAFGCQPCEGILSHSQQRNVVDGKKEIILNPSEKIKRETHTFEEGDVFGVDILISTGDGKVKKMEARTTVFKRVSDFKYSLKLPTSRKALSLIDKHFGAFPFALRTLSEQSDEKSARMGVIEPQKHGLLLAYDVFEAKPDDVVALFHTTIALTATGTVKLTGPAAFDSARIKSDKTLSDETLMTLIQSPLKPPKTKKKKDESAAQSKPDAE